jgi:phosphoglycerate dehydrogenase-like enzyme
MDRMNSSFRVGITPDFYVDAKGRFEDIVASQFGSFPNVECGPMPDQPGNVGTPDAIDQYDAIFAMALRFTAESLKGIERLALISRWGVGYDMIDTEAITEAGVALAITPNAVKRPVAEAIYTFIFALTTNLMMEDRVVRSGRWRGDLPRLGRNIKGKVLGSVGCGNIAQELFRMAQSLGFGRLLAYDPYVNPQAAKALNVELVPLEELMAQSDFVTINTLLNAQTRGLIGEPQLRLMKPTAYLINTARGPIIQEAALVKALRERWIAGAGLDVFEKEPLPQGNPLLELDNVILTPHGLAWTEEIVRDNGIEACQNILAIARGDVPGSVVNRDVIHTPKFQQKLARYRRNS